MNISPIPIIFVFTYTARAIIGAKILKAYSLVSVGFQPVLKRKNVEIERK